MPKKIVKQDFKLVNAKYKLNKNEQKLILYGISNIKEDDPDDMVYSLKLSEISADLHNEALGNKHTRIKKFCEDLLKKPLYIPRESEDGKKKFFVMNWFSRIGYEGDGTLTFRVDPDLKPYLIGLKKRFVKYNLANILPLNSTYSIRVYQLLKEYEKIGSRTISVDELHEMFQTPKSMRNLYSNFKMKVLNVAMKEINEHTDISFTFKEIKVTRKVTDIQFIIKKRLTQVDEETARRIDETLLLVPISERQRVEEYLRDIIHTTTLEVITSNIRYTNGNKPENYLAYLRACIKDDLASNARGMETMMEEPEDEQKELAGKCYHLNFIDRTSGCTYVNLNMKAEHEDRCKFCCMHFLPAKVPAEKLEQFKEKNNF
jgi:plasmid replication initiation protein